MPTLDEVGQALGLSYTGNPNLVLHRLAPIERANEGDLAFVAQKKFSKALASSSAAAVICPAAWVGAYKGAVLHSSDPYADYARVSRLFDNRPTPQGTISARATIADTASLGVNVTVDAGAVIEADVVIGDDVWVGANACIGAGATVGRGTELRPGVCLYHGVTVGEDCVLHANSVIGSDGFGFAPRSDGWEKILQLGAVTVGDRVEIGANCAIDRGALDDTVIGDDVIIDNLVHIAHGVTLGRQSAVAAQAGFAGGVELGDRCTVGGQSGFAGHLTVANDVHIGGQGRISRNVDEAGHYASGTSLMPVRDWARNAARYEKLHDMAKRLDALERALAHGEGSTE